MCKSKIIVETKNCCVIIKASNKQRKKIGNMENRREEREIKISNII